MWLGGRACNTLSENISWAFTRHRFLATSTYLIRCRWNCVTWKRQDISSSNADAKSDSSSVCSVPNIPDTQTITAHGHKYRPQRRFSKPLLLQRQQIWYRFFGVPTGFCSCDFWRRIIELHPIILRVQYKLSRT